MLSSVLGIALVLGVSATVWLTLGAGMFQLVRDGLVRMRHTAARRPVVREGYSQRVA